MKLALKWLLIGLGSTIVIEFLILLSYWPGDTGIETIVTTASGETFGSLIGYSLMMGGLPILIPTVVIASIGFFIEKKRVGAK